MTRRPRTAYRILATTTLALALCTPIIAHAEDDFGARGGQGGAPTHDLTADVENSPLAAQLAKADAVVRSVAPKFGCYDQTDRKTCQIWRKAAGPGGLFTTRDFPDGHHTRCFEPGGAGGRYQVCGRGNAAWGEIYDATRDLWHIAPYSDERCEGYGNRLSAEYLTCEAALPPPKQN